MKIGVDYYPEQWDKSLWEKDAEIMARTGVKVVRMGEYAWSGIEPEEGRFNFSWLDEVINIFARHSIRTVLAIPTNCPPMWLCQKYPDNIMRIDMNGRKLNTGISGNRCINSPVFRAYAKRMADEMMKHYSVNLSVMAWQIDNAMEAYQCTCETCREKFRSWLIDKYNDMNTINRVFGRSLLRGHYTDISQIEPPADSSDPALSLEWYKFTSSCTADFAKEIMLIVKQYSPKAPVTTNAALNGNVPDFYELYELLDFVSCNNYPPVKIPDDPENYYSHAFYLDMMRGIKGGRFWVMEQLSGALPAAPAPRQGMIMGYSLQALIHGADIVMHYRWRTALTGAEMFRHGILDHNNAPNRRLYEFAELCKRTEQLSVLDRTFIISDIAVIYSPESEKALELQPQSENFSYIHQLKAFYYAFTRFGVNVDVVPPDSDLTKYKIVVAPSLFINRKKANENIYRYVINGGTLILTNRSGVKDENNNCLMDSLPSVFKELIGAEVTEYSAIGNDTLTIKDFADNEFICGQWCDVMHLTTAKAYAEYNSGEYWSMPAVTLNRYCKGVAYYVGTVCKADFYESFASNLMMQTRIPKLNGLPRGVEVTTRTDGADEYICFFNNSENPVNIPLPKPMYSLISSICRDRMELRPFEADILRK